MRVWSRTFATLDWHTLRVVNAGSTPRNPHDAVRSDGFEVTF